MAIANSKPFYQNVVLHVTVISYSCFVIKLYLTIVYCVHGEIKGGDNSMVLQLPYIICEVGSYIVIDL